MEKIPAQPHYHVFMCVRVCVCARADNKNVYFSVYRFAKCLQCVHRSLNMPVCVCVCYRYTCTQRCRHTHTHNQSVRLCMLWLWIPSKSQCPREMKARKPSYLQWPLALCVSVSVRACVRINVFSDNPREIWLFSCICVSVQACCCWWVAARNRKKYIFLSWSVWVTNEREAGTWSEWVKVKKWGVRNQVLCGGANSEQMKERWKKRGPRSYGVMWKETRGGKNV